MDRLALVLALLLAASTAPAQPRFPPEIWSERRLGQATWSETFLEGIRAELDGKMKEAIRLYTVAARRGEGRAAFRIGEIYDRGLGDATPDYREALKWYNVARNLGYTSPPPLISYQQAISAERDGNMSEAIRLYERAAREGESKAADRLARIYGRGLRGVEPDPARSAEWRAIARAMIERAFILGAPKNRDLGGR